MYTLKNNIWEEYFWFFEIFQNKRKGKLTNPLGILIKALISQSPL